MKRYHIDFKDDRGSFRSSAIAETVSGQLVTQVQNFDGTHDRAVIEVNDEDVERLEAILDTDDNVTNYWMA